jgi:hypothetical protein
MLVKNEITPVEIDGKDRVVGDERKLIVESHWVSTGFVHLKWEGLNLLVSAADLDAAVRNARNHPR